MTLALERGHTETTISETEFVERWLHANALYDEQMRQSAFSVADQFDIQNVAWYTLQERAGIVRVYGKILCALVAQLPENVRAGGHLFIELTPAIFRYLDETRDDDWPGATPLQCVPSARSENFAAALSICAQWANQTIIGERDGRRMIAMPSQTVQSVINDYYSQQPAAV